MGILNLFELGLGTWAWGKGRMWDFGKGYGAEDIQKAFQVSYDAGIRMFDTASYTVGASPKVSWADSSRDYRRSKSTSPPNSPPFPGALVPPNC